MKKLLFASFVLMVGVTLTLSSCGSKLGGMVKGDSYRTEGWINQDTYRLTAEGVANRKLRNKVARRASAERSAIMNAKYKVLEKFKGSKVEGAAGMSDFENTGMAVAEEVQGYIKGGSVVKKTFDEEDNCEIIYEVKAKGLKKKVMAADWK